MNITTHSIVSYQLSLKREHSDQKERSLEQIQEQIGSSSRSSRERGLSHAGLDLTGSLKEHHTQSGFKVKVTSGTTGVNVQQQLSLSAP